MGRKQIELEDAKTNLASLNREYDNLLCMLAKVSAGEIDPKAIAVDLALRSWKLRVVPVDETPAE